MNALLPIIVFAYLMSLRHWTFFSVVIGTAFIVVMWSVGRWLGGLPLL